MTETSQKPVSPYWIFLIIAVSVLGYYIVKNLPVKPIEEVYQVQAQANLQTIKNQVAADAVKQYNIAKAEGDKMQTYVQAEMVCAAYLQAQDSVNYFKWMKIKRKAARVIGL